MTSHPTPTLDIPDRDLVPSLSAPLDALLVDAASASTLHRWLPGKETGAVLREIARRPGPAVDAARGWFGELTRIAVGTSTFEPSSRDRRFADTAWRDNPMLRRCVQAYLASAVAAQRVLASTDLDAGDRDRAEFLLENVIDALSPANSPLLNPTALKEIVNTGGLSLVRGMRNLAGDLAQAPRVPSMVDSSKFSVGGNLGVSPGNVVLRTPVFELIQYTPTTTDVLATPLLLVPPTINKFYVLDLAPGRSLVEHLVGSGQQVFAISWRNPTARHADWGLDAYVHAVIEALDAVREIAGSPQAHLFGACSGGIISAMASSYLASTGRQDELAGVTLAVTVLDQARAGLATSLMNAERAETAIARSRRAGYLDGRALAEVFAWLRPNDLVWNYWVNNYLVGKQPPAFDILHWNADTTRMPARLHHDFLDVALQNKLTVPGSATALGLPVDLTKVTVDSYMVGGVSDHITPWEACYRSSRLLGGSTRFVLSTSGHIAALVNPPGNPKANYQVSEQDLPDPKSWQADAETVQGSWWGDYVAWLEARSGPRVEAPSEPGRGRFIPLATAPGTYVHDR